MATVSNTIKLQDKMSPVLRSMITALHSTTNAMNMVDKESSQAFDQARTDIKSAEYAMEQFNSETDQIPNGMNKAKKAAGGLRNVLVTVAAGVYAIKQAVEGLSKLTGVVDQFTLTLARIDLMNDGLKTTADLQDDILASAVRSKAEFKTTADSVAKLGILAEDAFGSTQEIIAFTELLNKSFKVGGSGIQEQTSAMYQLTQAMAAGKLQGDEFRSIMENAPLLATAISDFMGIPKGQLKEMSSEGLITADIIKGALFGAADEINAKFETMPATFGSMWLQFKSNALEAFQPVIEKIAEIVNSEGFAQQMEVVTAALFKMGEMTYKVLSDVMAISNWVSTNWATMGPAISAIATLIGVIVAMITAWKIATTLMTVAQWLLNTALTANPIGVIIMGIAALIAIIIALIVWVRKLWGANLTFRLNVMAAWNVILAFFDKIPIFFAKIGDGIISIFENMAIKVMGFFQMMANAVIDVINFLIEALNDVAGTSVDLLDSATFADDAAANIAASQEMRDAVISDMEAIANARAAARDTELTAYSAEQKAKEYAQERSAWYKDYYGKDVTDTQGFDFNSFAVDGGTIDEVGSIRDDVSITEEDIKLLKDVAATEFINQYTTLRPELKVTFGDVRETADVNQLLGAMEELINDAYSSNLREE
jgi:tape measure domain-containing protein